jgi:hypothetical protein
MQKSDVFFKDFKISFIVAGLAFTVFFAMAIFFELARTYALSFIDSLW